MKANKGIGFITRLHKSISLVLLIMFFPFLFVLLIFLPRDSFFETVFLAISQWRLAGVRSFAFL